MADLRVLGPVQMWVAHRQVDLGPAKQQTVLAALLVDAGKPVTTETLIERVWGEDPPPSARSGLYSYITRLRQALRQAGNGTDPAPRLEYVPGGYQLEVERHRVDLHRFLRLIEQAKRPSTSDEQQAALLEQANRLWRGEALAGLGGDWAARTRDVLAQQRLEVALLWARSQLRLGRATAVIGPLRELVAKHPHVEPLAAMLIEALYRDGRSAEALDQFSASRDLLIAELGVEPGPEMRRLYRTILQGGLDAAAEPDPAPPAPVPAQLPLDVHGFTCRRRELTELDAVLAVSQEQPTAMPIAALLGTAGVGKTALAVHWAHSAAERFRDGQLYVNLRGFDPTGSPMTPAEALRGFLDALGVAPERRPADLAAQVGLYRSLVAGKKILVVLDNAATVEQVRPLLPGSPGCAVLITSRNRLGSLATAEGAHLLTLDLLNANQARQLLAARIGRKRVAAEPLPVNEIVARCAGLPLALAVVAARASEHPSFRLTGLAAQLRETREKLDAFQDSDPTADVRAVLSWSYRTVGSEAAGLFRLLALPPGPDIGVAAAASLAGLAAHRVLALLTELARAHLVVEHRPGRYTFHDLLRAYATELSRKADGDGRESLWRVLDHYLHTAFTAALLVSPHREPIAVEPPRPGVTPEAVADHEAALAWFADHHEILLAGIRVAAGSGFDGHAWGIAWTMTSHLDLGSHWQDLADTQAAALAAAGRLGDRAGQAYAHRILGRAKARLGCHAEARAQYERALAMCRSLGDHIGQAHTHLNLAWLLEQQCDYQAALEHARQAHDLYRVAGHRAGQGSALNQLGWYHGKLGNHEKALTHCEQALEMQRETGHRYGQASTWHSLGFAHHHLGHYEEAAACYGHAINLHRASGDRYREAETLVHLGDSHLAAEATGAARDAWGRALSILDRIGHPDAEGVRSKLAG